MLILSQNKFWRGKFGGALFNLDALGGVKEKIIQRVILEISGQGRKKRRKKGRKKKEINGLILNGERNFVSVENPIS